MLEKLESALRDECTFQPESGKSALIIVGVSGGPDSLCLLHALHRLGLQVAAAHLDHALRAESASEAEHVRRTAERLGVAAVVARRDVAALAQRSRLSIEEAARAARYEFLFRIAVQQGAAAVAVAHTADDQVETVLMHLLRGAGLAGLRGMRFRSLPNPWSEIIPLIRPLLGAWREEILSYVEANGLEPVFDLSNDDPRFYRNRLRREALPYLESLNPGFKPRLWQTAALLGDEDDLLAGLAGRAWEQCLVETTPRALALEVERLRAEPPAIRRRLLRRAAAVLRPGLRDIDYAAVERALEFIAAPPRSGQADWIAGLRLELEGKRLWLAEREADLPAAGSVQLPQGSEFILPVPGEFSLPGGVRLTAEILPDPSDAYAQAAANPDPFCAWLDLDRLALPLKIRARRPGERVRPHGMGGHSIKLSDFMINAGIPRRARAAWPLVVSGEEIAWVPGYRIGERFVLGADSRNIVRLRLLR